MDRYLATSGFSQQRSDRPARAIGNDNLFEFAEDGRERGGYEGHVMERSLYGVVARNPWFSLLAAVGVGAAFALGARARRSPVDAASPALDEPEPDAASYGTADVTPGRGPGALVYGDTSVSDAMQRGEVQAAAPGAGSAGSSRAHEQAVTRPLVAPLADMADTSTEDAPSASLLDPSRDSSRGDVGSTGREKTDEAWLTLG
jgi:hypothetical protein